MIMSISYPMAAAAIVNGLQAANFRPLMMAVGNIKSFQATFSSPSVANASTFKISSSLSSTGWMEFDDDGGPPRWFSPLECGLRSQVDRLPSTALLTSFTGIDGNGLGLTLHHQKLREEEQDQSTKRPIYLVGESLGASLAPLVAAHNPDIDFVLILANPVETVMWKVKMIQEMQTYLNSHLHVVKAQTMILTSGKDMLLTSITEGERLSSMLQNSQTHSFIGNDDPLFADHKFDLVAAIKCASCYRRGASADYVADFLPPSPSELEWMDVAVDPVMLSTVSGKVVQGLAGIPSEGHVLFVSNNMILGLDFVPILSRFWIKENIKLRTIAHPLIFEKTKDGKVQDHPMFDVVRITGGVPVSANNLYRLFSLKSHVLLYPGGAREGLHRKGEEHKLIWPNEPEFVRMAPRFGAKIVPFGTVGEDDVLQMKIPPLKALIEELTNETARLRSNAEGEIGKQFLYCPVALPKLPGRFYFLFGEPISTEGRNDVLTKQRQSKRSVFRGTDKDREVHRIFEGQKRKGSI
ncbi:hypothetical protein SASPL_110345 [Salvia splendens]|uniref:Uncharacterized protein n=1 Tax=Salvia splendens TaxID=180675 RepID=A0A8X8Y7J2_SALSN|nr:hypothetical protein SASPL_110345 [Salvia splendens]